MKPTEKATELIKNEPVMTAGVGTGLVTAVLYLLTTFGVTITADQQVAIIGVAAILLPLAFNWQARARVTPVHKLELPAELPDISQAAIEPLPPPGAVTPGD